MTHDQLAYIKTILADLGAYIDTVNAAEPRGIYFAHAIEVEAFGSALFDIAETLYELTNKPQAEWGTSGDTEATQ